MSKNYLSSPATHGCVIDLNQAATLGLLHCFPKEPDMIVFELEQDLEGSPGVLLNMSKTLGGNQ